MTGLPYPLPVRPRPGVTGRPPSVLRAVTARRAALATVALLVLIGVAHGWNMLHAPYLEDDEGTYFSQAWAVFHLGRLAPYTYFYDHAPLGWIQVGIWQLLTGGASLGYGLASGRVLMLVLQIGSALLTVRIGQRASGRLWVGLLAGALMSLLPYGLFYQRRILLDNLATFWILVSVHALTGRATMRAIWLSGAALGVAILSKEIAVAVVPAVGVLAWRVAPRESRPIAITGWCALLVAIVSTYVLLALVKSEFFEAGTPLGGMHPHVSLLCSLAWQSSRGSDGGLLQPTSAFWVSVSSWYRAEPLLVLGGTVAAIVLVVFARRRALVSMIGWLALSMWLFLGRGGVVLPFYLVPALPLLALALALAIHAAIDAVRRIPRVGRAATLAVAALAAGTVAIGGAAAYGRAGAGLWTAHPVTGQVAAERWIEAHLPRGSRMIIDMSMWQDLHAPSRGRAFTDAVYYWKAGDDPAIRRRIFGDSWRNVEYVITTPQLTADTATNDFRVVTAALEHSVLVKDFDTGWDVQIRRVVPTATRILMPLRRKANEPASAPGCMSYGT